MLWNDDKRCVASKNWRKMLRRSFFKKKGQVLKTYWLNSACYSDVLGKVTHFRSMQRYYDTSQTLNYGANMGQLLLGVSKGSRFFFHLLWDCFNFFFQETSSLKQIITRISPVVPIMRPAFPPNKNIKNNFWTCIGKLS